MTVDEGKASTGFLAHHGDGWSGCGSGGNGGLLRAVVGSEITPRCLCDFNVFLFDLLDGDEYVSVNRQPVSFAR
jgi:hypothetical protein